MLPSKQGFPGHSVVKNLPANAGDKGSIPDSGRSHMLQGTKPMPHNYWSLHALELVLCKKRSLHTATREQPQLAKTGEKSTQQEKLSTAKNK